MDVQGMTHQTVGFNIYTSLPITSPSMRRLHEQLSLIHVVSWCLLKAVFYKKKKKKGKRKERKENHPTTSVLFLE